METNNKLRETLVSVKKSIDDMGAASLNGDPEVLLMSLTQMCAGLSARIDAALAEPVKNYEVGAAEEQAERFENFCLEHIGCAEETGGRHCVGCPLEKASRHITQKCELYWAQMPYVEKEGGAR